MGGDSGRIRLMPHHAFSVAERNGERRVRRRIEGCVSLRQTTQCAGSAMRRRATLVARAARLADAVTNGAGEKRIGHGLSGRPAGGNGRQHLHHQREQDNR